MKLKQAKLMMRKYLDDNYLQDWQIGFMNKKTTAGSCYHNLKTIKLSSWFIKLNNCKRVHTTVLHEIAHARIDYGHGHGSQFKISCDYLRIDNASNTFINNDTNTLEGFQKRLL